MSRRADLPRTRSDILTAEGVLAIVREPPAPPAPAPGQPTAVSANPLEGDEVLLALWDDGSVTGLSGHVDLGTGLQTALAQILAEELDLTLACVSMALGDTARAPNQGATIASASIQIHAQPLRQAAAQARAWLQAKGAEWLGVPIEEVETRLGVVRLRAAHQTHVAYGKLLAGQRTVLRLDPLAALKDPANYRLVGTRQARVDIPAKLSGETVFVHDMRVPGMLHGRVVRPPYAGADHGDYIGNTLESVDESSIAHIPGIRAVVVLRDFVGVVAEREEHAEAAARELAVRWKPWPGMPNMGDVENAVRTNPATQRLLVDDGDVDAALAHGQGLLRTYLWPYQMHASIGPSCALAHWQPEEDASQEQAPADQNTPGAGVSLRVWAGTQNPHVLRADLATLMGLQDVQVDVVRMEAAGCYGRNCADDVAADAALLARATGAPVRVQLTRAQEHAWEPKGTAQLMEARGGLTPEGAISAYDFETSYPSNGAPTLALLLTRTIEPVTRAFEMGDRTARWPYEADNLRVKVNDMPPIVRASWLRGVSALPSSFAHESFVDELATQAGRDPVAFRLKHLPDPRAAEMVQATADKAGWRTRTGPQENADGGLGAGGDILFGQGFAYARYIHSKWPGFGAAWSAWVADVEVNRKTGEVHVRRVVVGHDAGMLINPAGVEHQVHGNVIQTTSRALKEKVSFAPHEGRELQATQTALAGVRPAGTVQNLEWGSYPILNFREVPVIDIVHMPRPGEAPLGAGESSSVPGTAAIANAIFDATGVRFRAPPFTPEVVLAGLAAAGALAPPRTGQGSSPPRSASPESSLPPPLGEGWGGGNGGSRGNSAKPSPQPTPTPSPLQARTAQAPWPRSKTLWATGGALLVGALGVIAGLVGWRPAIAPVQLTTSVYSTETIERGRLLAAAGDCFVCHSTPGGARGAGGLAMHTPFGTVFSTNLTPDAETGLGSWSFSAFQRAMREGLSRDGSHLYPAFPYTAFAKTSDDDLQALYAYLMSQPAVRAETPAADMRFPFNLRPLMAGWNALNLDSKPYQTDPTQTLEWNRGAYLVQGLGHCGACHTPRDATGAERGGKAFLSGAMVDGWEAPALTSLSKAAVPWDAQALYRYLRQGHSPRHGSAGGPMAEVVREMQALPNEDIQAMATYLASLNPAVPDPATLDAVAQRAVTRAALGQGALLGPAQRVFETACAACHHDGNGPTVLGQNRPLALSSKLTSDQPDNLIQTILQGVRDPATREIGFMQGFGDVLSDTQIAELATYLRARYAPQSPAWVDLPAQVARVRQGP
ncbi:molybdopterin cofactor-binding domain-containing protein [Ottowia thiooxydans]|uniref:molybdopterin cofactor-binding domain-containing protein n=1 Tax=Ottowia thiooxydans TaxID=219182 RepID=UPI00040E7A7D|nr:molybdopterin cofactor-binding domain-containing protein [Ottowia thiooxydans]